MNANKERYETFFPNATYWSNEKHWKWATEPNAREKASFLSENILPIEQSGQLKFFTRDGDITKNAFPNIDLIYMDGHTESQMLPLINYKGKKVVLRYLTGFIKEKNSKEAIRNAVISFDGITKTYTTLSF